MAEGKDRKKTTTKRGQKRGTLKAVGRRGNASPCPGETKRVGVRVRGRVREMVTRTRGLLMRLHL